MPRAVARLAGGTCAATRWFMVGSATPSPKPTHARASSTAATVRPVRATCVQTKLPATRTRCSSTCLESTCQRWACSSVPVQTAPQAAAATRARTRQFRTPSRPFLRRAQRQAPVKTNEAPPRVTWASSPPNRSASVPPSSCVAMYPYRKADWTMPCAWYTASMAPVCQGTNKGLNTQIDLPAVPATTQTLER